MNTEDCSATCGDGHWIMTRCCEGQSGTGDVCDGDDVMLSDTTCNINVCGK